jgi:phage terminase large subunit
MALQNPGMRGLIVRKTAVSLTSSALVTYQKIVAAEAIASGEVVFYGGSRQEAAGYRYGNGSFLTIAGLDKSSRIMSTEFDTIYCQEATELDENDWESLTTRLRNGVVSFQQLLADCNPGPPQHWLNQRCTRGQTVMIPCRHEDNPRLYDDGEWTAEGAAYLAILEALTGVRYLRLRKGLWAAAEGIIYDTFDPAVHLHKHIGVPPADWVRYLAVDFGYRNPFAALFIAVDHDNRMYVYREVYMTGRLVEDHARQILALIKRGDGHQPDQMPREVICDHDAEDRATLERHLGLSTVAAHKAVSEGIQAVQSRLKVDATGKPGLYLCRDALVERDPALEQAHKPLCLQDEILEYAWDMSAVRGGKQGAGDTLKEQPFKENDHSCDALRYAVAAIDLVGRPRLRFIR